MEKHYVHDSVSHRFSVGSHIFAFEVVEQFAGSWRGVLKLTDAAQIAAFSPVAISLGAREITKDEYEAFLKKKVASPLPFSKLLIPTPARDEKERGAAVVVAGGTLLQTKAEHELKRPAPKLEEALTVGKATFVDPLDERLRSRRKTPNKK